MEGQRKSGSSSSSSFTSELFGSSESQRSSSSSSAGIFGSMFPPPAKGGPPHKGSPGMGQQERGGQPCHLSSSLYYGGQDVCSSTTHSANFKKDKEDGDNNPQGASRGNWWQGSLYY
uniref:Uncharacterized protein n=1 Tax=Kalanchoe fedtschenkoi TaxID=63787 RepID=A0A7N0TG40_KALFE